MECELLVEANRVGDQRLAAHGEQEAVEQFHRLPGRAEYAQVAWRETLAVPDDAAQVFRRIPGELLVDEGPGRLARQTARELPLAALMGR